MSDASYTQVTGKLINRQDAIDAFGLSEKTRKYGGDHSGYDTMMLYEIQNTLESLPSAQPEGWVHIDDIYRLISGHSNYHGDNILATLTCLAEGKEVPNPIDVLEQPERKKGEWTIMNGELAFWDVCSECKKLVMHKAPFYKYCPNCGADMRGEQE